jgi:hypothetical protein
MCAKLKEEALQWPLLPTPCWHIDEKTCSPIGVNIQKPSQLEGKTCPLEIDPNKNHILLEPQLSSQPHKKNNL